MTPNIRLHGQYLQALGKIMAADGRNAGLIEHNPSFYPRLIALMVKAGADEAEATAYVGITYANEAVNAQF